MYTKMSNNEAALWTDASTNQDSKLSMVLNKGVIDVLGYKCDELVLNCKTGTQKYYFNSKLSVDPKLYVNHAYGNWYYFVSRSNALPLKMEIDTPHFTLTSTAVAVKPGKLDAGIFKLPDGIKIEKDPF